MSDIRRDWLKVFLFTWAVQIIVHAVAGRQVSLNGTLDVIGGFIVTAITAAVLSLIGLAILFGMKGSTRGFPIALVVCLLLAGAPAFA